MATLARLPVAPTEPVAEFRAQFPHHDWCPGAAQFGLPAESPSKNRDTLAQVVPGTPDAVHRVW